MMTGQDIRPAVRANQAPPGIGLDFQNRTFVHAGIAMLAFIGLVTTLAESSLGLRMAEYVFEHYKWIPFFVLCVASGRFADSWAHSATSTQDQYVALALYTIAEAMLCTPLLVVATEFFGPQTIPVIALLTLTIVGGFIVFTLALGNNLSSWSSFLALAGTGTMAAIVVFTIFEFSTGMIFSCLMIAVSLGSISLHASNTILEYSTDRHVAASLAFVAAFALVFFYLLKIIITVPFTWNDEQ